MENPHAKGKIIDERVDITRQKKQGRKNSIQHNSRSRSQKVDVNHGQEDGHLTFAGCRVGNASGSHSLNNRFKTLSLDVEPGQEQRQGKSKQPL
jgi:hypothetical protein